MILFSYQLKEVAKARVNHPQFTIWLVVLTILKNMKVNGKDDIPYIMENKKMFETTNQP